MLVVQLSDPHIGRPGGPLYDQYKTHDRLAQALADVATLEPAPDAVILTGDLVDAGDPDEYALLRELLGKLSAPTYMIPGNHDDRDQLRAAFPDADYLPKSGFLCFAVELGSLRMVCLDTNIPRDPCGELCPERLAWLDAALAADPDTPTIVALHHPPFKTGIRAMDAMGLREGGVELEVILRKHDQVERVICGHLHRSITRRFAGTVVATCPSTSHQIELALDSNRLAVISEPPGYFMHYFSEETGLVTHTRYVKNYEVAAVLRE